MTSQIKVHFPETFLIFCSFETSNAFSYCKIKNPHQTFQGRFTLWLFSDISKLAFQTKSEFFIDVWRIYLPSFLGSEMTFETAMQFPELFLIFDFVEHPKYIIWLQKLNSHTMSFKTPSLYDYFWPFQNLYSRQKFRSFFDFWRVKWKSWVITDLSPITDFVKSQYKYKSSAKKYI